MSVLSGQAKLSVIYVSVSGGGGTPLFGLDRYVPLNMIWFSKSQIGYTILLLHLQQGVFLDQKPSSVRL